MKLRLTFTLDEITMLVGITSALLTRFPLGDLKESAFSVATMASVAEVLQKATVKQQQMLWWSNKGRTQTTTLTLSVAQATALYAWMNMTQWSSEGWFVLELTGTIHQAYFA